MKNIHRLYPAFLFLIGWFAYRHLFSISFLADDFELMRNSLLWIDPGAGFFRPLPKLIATALHGLFGVRTFPFHLLSLLIHCANALLVYFIVARLAKNRLAALAASSLFIAHYLSSEAVFWIASLNALLVTLFILLAIHSFLDYLATARTAFRTRSLLWLALGLLSNENAVVLPLLLLILHGCRARSGNRQGLSRQLRDLAGHFIVLAGYALVKLPALAVNVGEGTLSLGHHLLRNLRFMLLSLFTFNPFNDLPFVFLDLQLMNVFLKIPMRTLGPAFAWGNFYLPLLLGSAIIVLVLVILLRGQTRLKLALFAVIVSILPVIALSSIHLPYGGYYRHPLRLFYFPAALFMIFIGLALAWATTRLRRGKRTAKYLPLLWLLVFSLLFAETAKTSARSSDWLQASAVARSILGQFKTVMDAHPQARRAVVFNLPDNFNGAYIFKNGFAAAVALHFPGARWKIDVRRSPAAAAGVANAMDGNTIWLDCSAGDVKVLAK